MPATKHFIPTAHYVNPHQVKKHAILKEISLTL